jgi:3-isopropylmalate dehydrogenase
MYDAFSNAAMRKQLAGEYEKRNGNQQERFDTADIGQEERLEGIIEALEQDDNDCGCEQSIDKRHTSQGQEEKKPEDLKDKHCLNLQRGKGVIENDRVARDTLVITRDVCEPLFDFSFKLARQRKKAGKRGRLTCVDKSNVFTSFAFFRKIFGERAIQFADIEAAHGYIDSTALAMVLKPWDFDVLVTENMFGDILSDLLAGLIGGMGYAPSADIGADHAVFQPAHGSAPDIAGQGKANPTAMFLSGAMMLEWLGDKHGSPTAIRAGALIRDAVDTVFADGKLKTCEFGGTAGTKEVTKAVMHAIRNSAHE